MGNVLLAGLALALASGTVFWLVRFGLGGLWRAGGRLRAATWRARRGDFGRLEPGEVTLRGEVVAIDLVDSPVSETGEVCFVDYVVESWDSTTNNTGMGGKWVCADRGAVAAPFELSDGETSVVIDPRGARLDAPRKELAGRSTLEQRVHEAVLLPGDEVVVHGAANHEGGFGASSAYRGHGMRLVVGAGGAGGALVIAPAGRGYGLRLVGRLGLWLTGVVGGGTLVVLALLFASNALPWAEVEVAKQIVRDEEPRGGFWVKDYSRLPERYRGRRLVKVRFAVYTLGWQVGGSARRHMYRTIRDELWRRRLDGMVIARQGVERRGAFSVRYREGLAFSHQGNPLQER